MQDRSFIEKITELAEVKRFTVDGREYADKKLDAIVPPFQSAVTTVSLTSVKDYFAYNPDKIDLVHAVVLVCNPMLVQVVSPVQEPWLRRHEYLKAQCSPKQFNFDLFMPVEKFMIALQTYFVPSDTVGQLLQVIGNLSVDHGVKTLDDGVSQQVVSKSGITQLSNVILPNPIDLSPYRTFYEVEQPTSKFILRIKKDSDGSATAALFEADGGNWSADATGKIKAWLLKELPAGTTILE